jgi:hypothetical protein
MNLISNSIHIDKAISLIQKMIDEKRCTIVFTKSSTIETGTKYLAFDIDYNKGGLNSFSCKMEKRGYRFHVSLRKKTELGYSTIPMENSSFKIFIGNEVKRDSKKAFNDALADLQNLLKNETFIERIAYSVSHC